MLRQPTVWQIRNAAKKTSLSLYIFWGRRPRYPLRETMGGIVASEEEEGNFLCPTNNKTPQLFFGAHSCFPQNTQRTFIPFIFQGKNWRRRQQVFSPFEKKNKFQLIVYAKSSEEEENSVAVSQRLSASFVTATWERPGEKKSPRLVENKRDFSSFSDDAACYYFWEIVAIQMKWAGGEF